MNVPRCKASRAADRPCGAALAVLLLVATFAASAQDIEPRSYSNAPAGVNFLIAGFLHTKGGVAFASDTGISNPDVRINGAVFAYVRTLDLWGMSGKFDAVLPYSWLQGTAEYRGQTVERKVDGQLDPRFRLSVNFYGAPALELKDFRNYKQDLIVGASLQVSAPLGQYDETKLVNLGNNRWFFKPELGVSKAMGEWTLEGKLAATIYTKNDDFFNGNTRKQAPIYSAQANAIYSFANGVWGSLDATYYQGGRTTLNGERNFDLQKNWRVGGTLALPVDAQNSVKIQVSSGVSARTGNNYDLIGFVWQYRWGGGL
jgi:hypothetical protein